MIGKTTSARPGPISAGTSACEEPAPPPLDAVLLRDRARRREGARTPPRTGTGRPARRPAARPRTSRDRARPTIVAAEIRETSRSTERPPKSTTTRRRLTSSPRGLPRPPARARRRSSTAGGGGESTAITAAAPSPLPRAEREVRDVDAALRRGSCPTLPTTPGTSRFFRNTTVPSGRNSSGRSSTATTRASRPEKSVASARVRRPSPESATRIERT